MTTDLTRINESLTAATAHSKVNGQFISSPDDKGAKMKAGTFRRSSTPGVIHQPGSRSTPPEAFTPSRRVITSMGEKGTPDPTKFTGPSKPAQAASIHAALKDAGFKLSEPTTEQIRGRVGNIAVGSRRIDGNGWKAKKDYNGNIRVENIVRNRSTPTSQAERDRSYAQSVAESIRAREALHARGFITEGRNISSYGQEPRYMSNDFIVTGRQAPVKAARASRTPTAPSTPSTPSTPTSAPAAPASTGGAPRLSRKDVIAALHERGYHGPFSHPVGRLNEILADRNATREAAGGRIGGIGYRPGRLPGTRRR